ncbi:MAG: hypothetical protein LBS59_06030, partial [Puniceicoccales bacterium]|nr:hypothetical protein [Puniceicoccales bacterium]
PTRRSSDLVTKDRDEKCDRGKGGGDKRGKRKRGGSRGYGRADAATCAHGRAAGQAEKEKCCFLIGHKQNGLIGAKEMENAGFFGLGKYFFWKM